MTLSAAGASGLVGMGCASSALGGLKDGDDEGPPLAPVAGGTAQQPNVPPVSKSPPFVENPSHLRVPVRATETELQVRLTVRLCGRATAERLFGSVPADAR